ncbi:MAG: prephenate dehydrogenase [Gammaproteobacteria bacterium RBG_16_57_12]|nr:MAG: prephenate dehydrogenase [Gammaproteobacteria bacterium RBG_16_57_12]
MINRLTIIGVGLIGGSLARALRQARVCREIVGCGRELASLRQAQALGVIDRIELDPGAAVMGADMVVVAVPLGAMESVFRAIAPHVGADAVITDVGSAKASVIGAARRGFGTMPAQLVLGHPIAGTERSGVEASYAELFAHRKVILTPLQQTARSAVERVRDMWQATGAQVVEMSVEHHDKILAATSHLPHMLAYTLVDTLARMGEHDEIFSYAAGGFRDFTRIASSDPQMWHDICLSNREALLAMLDLFIQDLGRLREAVGNNDSAYLLTLFQRAKQARDHFAQQFKA